MSRDQIRNTTRQKAEGRLVGAGVFGAVAISLIFAAALLPTSSSPALADQPGEQLEFGVKMARRGLWSEALFRFEKAALEDPANPRILNNLAVANEAVGNFDEALDLYREAVELDSANPELKRNYARFVEFYQSFRPREEKDDSEDREADAEDSASEDSPPQSPEGTR